MRPPVWTFTTAGLPDDHAATSATFCSNPPEKLTTATQVLAIPTRMSGPHAMILKFSIVAPEGGTAGDGSVPAALQAASATATATDAIADAQRRQPCVYGWFGDSLGTMVFPPRPAAVTKIQPSTSVDTASTNAAVFNNGFESMGHRLL